MDEGFILQSLEDIAREKSIEIIYDNLAGGDFYIQSGSCKVLGKQKLIIDKRLPLMNKIKIISQELRKLNLEDMYIPPKIRELIKSP